MIVFQKQPMMRRVLVALAPVCAFSIWLYGARSLAIAVVSFAVGFLVEWLFERKRSGKVSEAVLVTCALYSMSLPPRTPLWIVAVGIAFAVFMAKEVYGGFGRNVFNPAIAGRLFVYIAFATVLNKGYAHPGGFGSPGPDVIASATPLAMMRADPSAAIDLPSLLFGVRPGAVGESPTLLIALCAVYLMATKTASWRIIVSELAAGTILTAALYFTGVGGALPLQGLLAGSYLFVAVFMATDPISAPKKPLSQAIYGAFIGCCTVAIRTFSAFPEGTSFGILLGNTFAPFIDELVTKAQEARKGAAA
ncbi:MAG: RnfABCDGE type electron transport complex subunit D [Spirochaetaceae bacterium]|nr:RnfABCDGE type electron transport complex subunit D [Spirochaetaceae bacterium]